MNVMDALERCPACGETAEVVREERDVAISSHLVRVTDEFMRCSGCGETYYLPGGMEATEFRAAEKIRQVHGLMQPVEIRALRESLGLTQAQLGCLLNVGPTAAGQWEKGTAVQSGTADTLLRLLNIESDVLPLLGRLNNVSVGEAAQTTRRRGTGHQGVVSAAFVGDARVGEARSGRQFLRPLLIAASIVLVVGIAATLSMRDFQQRATPLAARVLDTFEFSAEMPPTASTLDTQEVESPLSADTVVAADRAQVDMEISVDSVERILCGPLRQLDSAPRSHLLSLLARTYPDFSCP